MTERERAMLATLAIRAEKYYLAAGKLTPLLDRDSRAAMWVLVTIYHRLLAPHRGAQDGGLRRARGTLHRREACRPCTWSCNGRLELAMDRE